MILLKTITEQLKFTHRCKRKCLHTCKFLGKWLPSTVGSGDAVPLPVPDLDDDVFFFCSLLTISCLSLWYSARWTSGSLLIASGVVGSLLGSLMSLLVDADTLDWWRSKNNLILNRIKGHENSLPKFCWKLVKTNQNSQVFESWLNNSKHVENAEEFRQ